MTFKGLVKKFAINCFSEESWIFRELKLYSLITTKNVWLKTEIF